MESTPLNTRTALDHAPVLVVHGVEDEGLEGGVGVALRGRDAGHRRVEQLGHALAGLGADAQDRGLVDAEDLLDLVLDPLGVGRRQVDLVDRGHDLEVGLDGLVAGGEGLGLDALGGVDQEDGALAGGQRARHLVAEVDVAGRVDEVDGVALPRQAHVLGLDGDAPLPLEVHRVEVLLAHVAGVDRPRQLEDAVGQGGLAVVDVADDRQVADGVAGDHGVTSIVLQARPPDRRRCSGPYRRTTAWICWTGKSSIRPTVRSSSRLPDSEPKLHVAVHRSVTTTS